MHITLIKLFLTLANALLQNARDKRLIDGAIAEHALKGLEDANKAIADTRIAQSDDSVRESTRKKYTRD